MNADKLLKHMAWANQEIIGEVAELQDSALDAFLINPEWTVREIARHIASSATFYGWRLLDKSNFSELDTALWDSKLEETKIPPTAMKDMALILARLEDADALLIVEAQKPEADVHSTWNGKPIVRKRSTIISQAIHHATEHRAQLVAALEAKGFNSINLDDYDLWNYADTIGE